MNLWSLSKIDDLKRLAHEGQTNRLIAAKTGMSKTSVATMRARLGLPSGPHGRPADRVEVIATTSVEIATQQLIERIQAGIANGTLRSPPRAA